AAATRPRNTSDSRLRKKRKARQPLPRDAGSSAARRGGPSSKGSCQAEREARPVVRVACVACGVVVGAQTRIDHPVGLEAIFGLELDLPSALASRQVEARVIALAVLVACLHRPVATEHPPVGNRIARPVRRDGGARTIVALFAVIETHGAGQIGRASWRGRGKITRGGR